MTVGARRAGLGDRVLVAVVIALAAGFTLLPALGLLAPGGLLVWHVQQRAYVEGGLEIVLLAGAGALALWRRSATWAIVAAVILGLLYLRRHHVDVPLGVALAYFEAIVATGTVVLRRFGVPKDPIERMLQTFTLGFALLGLLVLVASLIGAAAPETLRWIVSGLGLFALLLARQRPASLVALDALRHSRRAIRLTTWLVLVALFAYAARTNSVVGFDGLWYGLRGEYVLAPNGSIFDTTGLVFPVFYFPKLYEAALLPLAALRDFSFINCFSVITLFLVGATTFHLQRQLNVRRLVAYAGAAAVVTIPAFANLALTPKPDVMAALLALIAASSLVRSLRAPHPRVLGIAVSATLLAGVCKLTVLPYLVALWAAYLAVVLLRRRRATVTQMFRWAFLVPVVAALLVAVGFTARTVLLAGMPTIAPEALVSIWQMLGFSLRPPVETIQWTFSQQWSEVPALAARILFRPSDLDHMVITWIGNWWLWVAILGVTGAGWKMLKTSKWLLVTPAVTGVALVLGIGYLSPGGDGNYLLVPVALGAVLAIAMMVAAFRTRRLVTRVLMVVLMCTAGAQFAYSFANAEWSPPGTRPLDLDFTRSIIDTPAWRTRNLANYGLAQVNEYLARRGRTFGVVGITAPEPAGNLLETRYESLREIQWVRPDDFTDSERLRTLFRGVRANALLLPISEQVIRDTLDDPQHADALVRFSTECHAPPVVSTPAYRLFLIDPEGSC